MLTAPARPYERQWDPTSLRQELTGSSHPVLGVCAEVAAHKACVCVGVERSSAEDVNGVLGGSRRYPSVKSIWHVKGRPLAS